MSSRHTPALHRGPPLPRNALVSVCVPTFNRGPYIERALDSALGQTYEPLEVIVVDDASEDDTLERLRKYRDPRLKLSVNARRLGHNANRNRTLVLASGQLIKFLDSDDELTPDCVTKMVDVFTDDSAVGLTFSRRKILFERENGSSESWLDRYGRLHEHFVRVERVNDGRDLLAQWLAGGLEGNWIGEPSAAMVRRWHLQFSGGFAAHVVRPDMDFWTRLLSHCLVGFIDEELVTLRRGHESETSDTERARKHWTDRLWTLETLAREDDIRSAFPEVRPLLSAQRRQAWRTAARLGHVRGGESVPVTPYVAYLKFRALCLFGLPPPLFERLPPVAV